MKTNEEEDNRITTKLKGTKVNEWMLKADDKGHFNIRISRDGKWLHEGTPIARESLVKLFSSVLHKDNEGQHWLVTPVEKGRIDVEIAPLFITAVWLAKGEAGHPSALLSVRCSTGEHCHINSSHPLSLLTTLDGETFPVVLVRDGLLAHFNRASYYDLMGQVVEGSKSPETLGIWSGSKFFTMQSSIVETSV